MKFDTVTIKNFRNFEDITISLTNKNVLFGMNDVGKTNFLYALRYIFDKDIRRQNFSDTDYYKKNTKKPIEILISIDISDTEDADSQKLRAKLKHQLKWIGKEYDPSCWLFSAQKRLELISFLDAACESRPLRQGGAYHEQDDFAEQCKDLMLALPVPPQQLHRNRSRYKDGKLPSINLLNKYLLELDLPYEIDNNKQERFEGVDKKKTVWTVKRKGPENTPEEERSSPE